MTIRAVIFDIGGVLVFTPDLGVTAKWEALLGLRPGEIDQKLMEVWKGGSIGTLTEAEIHQQIGAILAISQDQVTAFMGDIWREYLGTLNVDLTDFFRGLRPRVRTAIISNSFVGAREREQAHYQIDDLCDFIIYSHEVGVQKPDPRIFALAYQRLDMQPSEIIFLDDNAANITAARALGMQAILFTDTRQAIAEIENLLQM